MKPMALSIARAAGAVGAVGQRRGVALGRVGRSVVRMGRGLVGHASADLRMGPADGRTRGETGVQCRAQADASAASRSSTRVMASEWLAEWPVTASRKAARSRL